MINIHKRNNEINNLLKDSNLSTKIKIFFSTRSVGEDFDPREKNYTTTNLNYKAIKGYVRDIKAESLIWSQYGLAEVGAKEIICEARYAEWFKKANKIEIDGDTYQVYRENVGNRVLIVNIPFKLIKVIIRKMR